MINLSSNVAIRYCLNRVFFINIHTNKVSSLSKEAAEYLLREIEKGITEEYRKRSMENKEFVNMITILIMQGILEVTSNEI